MCGRFTITCEAEDLRAALDLASIPEDFIPRFNIAPSQPILSVTNADLREAQWMRWGLIPFWAKDPSIGSRMINARSETLMEKPAFRQAFQKRRCLLPADGFYEWKAASGRKGFRSPYYFHLSDRRPFFLAGLWETWDAPDSSPLLSATILTTTPNELVANVHDRMPVIFSGEMAWKWLENDSPAELIGMLKPYPAQRMVAHPVSTMVNSPQIDRADCVTPANSSTTPGLFE